jgi:AraC-like DNA-binding protein
MVWVDDFPGAPDSPRHFHREYELIYVLGVRGEREIASTRCKVTGEDLVLLGPDLTHRWSCLALGKDSRFIVLRFNETSLGKELLDRPVFSGVRSLLVRARHGLAFRLDSIGSVTRRILELPDLPESRQGIALWDILVMISDAPCEICVEQPDLAAFRTADERRAFNKVRELILAQPNKKTPLADAAAVAGMSTSSFSRFVRRVTGRSFIDYVNREKLHMAGEMLRESDRPVLDIALDVGINSLSHFNRLFTRLYGCSPSQYRKHTGRR